MESQPQNPEFRNKPENFHPCCWPMSQYRMQLFYMLSATSVDLCSLGPGPQVIKLFSCSTKLSTKFVLLINVKMPTIVGILTFISMISTTSEKLKPRNFFVCRYLSFYEKLKFLAQLS